MYQTICMTTKRTYNQADQWLREQYRKRFITEDDQPKIIHIDATDLTPAYYSVMIRVSIEDRRW